MNADIKLQLALMAASGVFVALIGFVLVGLSGQVTASAMRLLLPIPPIGVAAYIFVFSFLRGRAETWPSLAEAASAVLQGTFVSAMLFALMAAGMVGLARLITKIL